MKTHHDCIVDMASATSTKTHTEPRKVKPNGQTGMEFTTSWIKKHRLFSASDLSTAFKKGKRNPKSASPVLSKLKADGTIKLMPNGMYARMK